MLPTKEMYDVTHSKSRVVHIKLELLNYEFNILDTITGHVLDGTLSADANSDIRRNCNVNMLTYNINNNSLDMVYWLDKYIKIYIGLETPNVDDIIWFNKGIYLMSQPQITVTGEGCQIAFDGTDLMGKLTGVRGGVLGQTDTQFKIGQNIRDIVISTLAQAGFTEYVIEIPPEDVLQEDLSFDPTQTLYDILCSLRNTYYPNYQTYFDEDGVFRFYKMPTGESDAIVADSNTFKELCMQYSSSVDLDNVKNSIEVFGRTHEPTYLCTVSQIVGDTYMLTCEEMQDKAETKDEMFEVEITTEVENPKFNINNTTALPIVDGNDIPIDKLTEGLWVFIIKRDRYILVGNLQSYAKVTDDNPESPFYINSTIGELKLVLSGGEYDLITTNELAIARAKYELYNHARLNDTLSILTVPILYLEVYDLIEFTNYDGHTYKYLIQNINTPLNGSGQTLTVSRFYPDYTII